MIALFLLSSLSLNALCANVTVKNSEQHVKKTIPKVKYVGDYKGTPVSLSGEHIVQKGETLFGIAKYYQIDHKEILALNNMKVESGVKVGQKLKIPQPKNAIKEKKAETKSANVKNHIVMQGETLFGIARNYGINPLDLATENNIDLSYMVKVGQKLKIPQIEDENEKPKENKPMPSVQNIAKGRRNSTTTQCEGIWM
jgi:LysM repeat protein